MALSDPTAIVEHLRAFQSLVRELVIASHGGENHSVARASSADTIYAIDTAVEPLMIEFFEGWATQRGPIVLVAEGLEDEQGREVESRIFPAGASEAEADLRVIVDPIDGTRGIMYDKRSAWALAGAAPNRGATTRLRDIEAAVMTELPTSKMGAADVLWAIKGSGAHGERVDLATQQTQRLSVAPSKANSIEHGFASVVSFFPGTKVIAAELMERLAAALAGEVSVSRATVFDDQYISTGGQFYELLAGHDRFVADLRPAFYRIMGKGEGLSCHPYDCATLLIAEEAGVIVTDDKGRPLDGPLDTTTGLAWIAYANESLRRQIEPLILAFLKQC